MTTREIYFKAYMISDKPQGMFYYTILRDGMEITKMSGWFDLNKDWHEANIAIMEGLAKQEGFMFWNISPECDEWVNKKSKGQRTIISVMAFVQR